MVVLFDLLQDLHNVDLEEFKYGGTNITALRLVDPEKPDLQRVVRDWVSGEQRLGRKLDLGVSHQLGVRIICTIYYRVIILKY